MVFLNRISGVLRQTVSKSMKLEFPASNTSLYQPIRSMSSSKLFVGGISYGTDERSLRDAFAQHGEVIEARVVMDRETGRSRGFGFVTYTSTEEASSAIQALDGQDIHGRRIRVSYAIEKPRLGGYRGGFGNESDSYGGAARYGNNNFGGPAGGYGNTSNYGGTGAYGSNVGGGLDYSSNAYSDSGVNKSGGADGGDFATTGDSEVSSLSYSIDQGKMDPDQTGTDGVNEFGDDVVEGDGRDDDTPDDFANTRRIM